MAAANDIEVQVHYPLEHGRIALRSDADWERNVEAEEVSADRSCARFRLVTDRPFTYFKPVVISDAGLRWARGGNYLAVAGIGQQRTIYPYFNDESGCSACSLRELASPGAGGTHSYRVFYPPGYAENHLKRYPVVYMHDGQNLFFPQEAFQGHHWRIPETLSVLDTMNAIDKVVVVGVYPNDRMREYTAPGYEEYGRFLVEDLKPAIDAEFRTLTGPRSTAVMGSSLGGVVSLHTAWSWPEVFGMAACLSSTFGWRDDLRERVATEPKRDLRLYLDSGWPRDNYEVTRDMRDVLAQRGYVIGADVMYLAFPQALHNEQSWALRAHIPFQFFFGRRARATPLPAAL